MNLLDRLTMVQQINQSEGILYLSDPVLFIINSLKTFLCKLISQDLFEIDKNQPYEQRFAITSSHLSHP